MEYLTYEKLPMRVKNELFRIILDNKENFTVNNGYILFNYTTSKQKTKNEIIKLIANNKDLDC